jgi:hypothetical protein
MITAILVLVVLCQSALASQPSLVAKWSEPPRRNFFIISYDDSFLFAARHYGSADDPGGNTEPGLFVHSKQYESWMQVTQISTAGGRFGTSGSDNPDAQKKLRYASVGWDFRSLAARPYAEQPLRTSGSIAFPEKISFDAATDRYELRYLTSWDVPSAETVLYIRRGDLLAAFAATTGKGSAAQPPN